MQSYFNIIEKKCYVYTIAAFFQLDMINILREGRRREEYNVELDV